MLDAYEEDNYVVLYRVIDGYVSMTIEADEWKEFLQAVKNGEFDEL